MPATSGIQSRPGDGATSQLVGIQPRFPFPFNRWDILTRTIPAERVAALRIATALVLLLDLGVSLLPQFQTLFSSEALGGRDQYPWRFREGHLYWSLLRLLPEGSGPPCLFGVWIVSAFTLLIGYRPLVSGLICWVCAVSFWNINPWITNGGDQLRNSLLFLVALSHSGAVWGVQSVQREGPWRPVVVPGWPVLVLIVQLASIYFFSGVHKLLYPQWREGFVMYFVYHDLTWSLAPQVTSLLPLSVHKLSTWFTLVWEIAFPVLIAFSRTRAVTLVIGVIFHVLTFFTLEVGAFALYSLVFYVVFVPWERLSRRPLQSAQ